MGNNLRQIHRLLWIVLAALIFLMASHFNLAIIQGEKYSERSIENRTRTISVMGSRGRILDTNGVPLAYDKTSYNINFYRDPYQTGEKWRAIYTNIIMETIEILEKNGNKVIDDLSIQKDENGGLTYYWGGITDEDAIKRRKELWCGNMTISEDATAEEAFNTLRQRYMIPDDVDYEMAHKVLSIWQEVQNLAFKSYVPVTIAQDVDANSVAEITTRSTELIGMSAEQSYTRVYPKNTTAAHIVGYMGKVYSEEELAELEEKGYSTDATVGVSGVEATMEEQLSAAIGTRVGKQKAEVNSRGKVTRRLESKEPQSGNDVMLTIDYELQQKLESALENNIKIIRQEQEKLYNQNYAKYEEKEQDRGGTKTKFASMGAAIVMDVNTGNVLAMASYPSFDPNMFIGGISEEDYQALNDPDTAPLFNKAISSASEPGSIFKPVTGYAALMEGVITPEETIDCQDEYTPAVQQGKAPGCWTDYPQNHQGENIVKALKDSCNYYFYTVSDRMGIDKLTKWADTFGLSSKTGIELPGEVTSHVANQQVLYDNTKEINGGQLNSKPYLVRLSVEKQLKKYGLMRGVTYTDEQVERCATRIVQLVGSSTNIGPQIRSIMREELDIPESTSYARRWHQEINSILYEITWNRVQTILTGIGQSVTAVTPIAVARYISAIANGGNVYEASIIKKVVAPDGSTLEENDPKVVSTLGDTKGYLEYIKEGMHEVVSAEDGGTAANIFTGFEYTSDIAAKTGTAQVSQIDLENSAWFVAFTPFEQAEIAVVVFIPNGYAGSMAGYTARDIIQFYRDRQKQQTNTTVTAPGGMVE